MNYSPNAVNGTDNAPRRSALAAGIEARGRRGAVVDCSRFMGLGQKPCGPAFVQVPSVADELEAVDAAQIHASKLTLEATRKDPDFINTAKSVELVWRAFRDDADRKYPLFPGPDWMRANLTSDEIGALLNILLEVRREHGPDPVVIQGETVQIIADACAKSDAMASNILAGLSREQLTAAFVLLSIDWARRGVNVEALNFVASEAPEPVKA